MKNKYPPHLADLRYAGRLRFQIKRKLGCARLAMYILIALAGVLLSILTNASGVRYDADGGKIYRQPYRVQTSKPLAGLIGAKADIYDFTRPSPEEQPLTDYDLECNALLFGPGRTETALGLPGGRDDKTEFVNIYFPSTGAISLPVSKTFTGVNLTVPTLFVPENLYEEYNRAYEALRSCLVSDMTPGPKDRNLLALGGVLAPLEAGIDIVLPKEQAERLNLVPDSDISAVTLKVICGDREITLNGRIEESGRTLYNYRTMALIGADVERGQTVIFENLKDAYRAKELLRTFEDPYASFNSAQLYQTNYKIHYELTSPLMIGVYLVFISLILVAAYAERQAIRKLERLGLPPRLARVQYALATAALALISVLVGFAVYAVGSLALKSYGALFWFNVYDYIVIILIEACVAGADIFVATRGR